MEDWRATAQLRGIVSMNVSDGFALYFCIEVKRSVWERTGAFFIFYFFGILDGVDWKCRFYTRLSAFFSLDLEAS